MKKILFMALAITGMACASCQSSTWKISGKAPQLEDGVVLYITTDFNTGVPMDSAVVKDGEFTLAGDEDTVMLGMLYSPGADDMKLPIIIEKGHIKITQSLNPDSTINTVVSGTPSNDKWFALNEAMSAIDPNGGIEPYREIITKEAEENAGTEYGYLLLTQYDDGMTIVAEKRLELIEKLPANMQARPEMAQLLAQTKKEMGVAIGAKIPDFTMNDIKGKETTIYKEIAGKKIIILDFWASWCPPCRAEMPRLVALYAKYAPKGLGIVGISLDSDMAAWKKETQIQGITWNQLSDLQGWKNAAAELFSVRSIPQMFIVDSEGTILAKGLRGEELEKFVAEKLDK